MYVPDRFSLKSSRVQDGMGLYTARRVRKVGDPAQPARPRSCRALCASRARPSSGLGGPAGGTAVAPGRGRPALPREGLRPPRLPSGQRHVRAGGSRSAAGRSGGGTAAGRPAAKRSFLSPAGSEPEGASLSLGSGSERSLCVGGAARGRVSSQARTQPRRRLSSFRMRKCGRKRLALRTGFGRGASGAKRQTGFGIPFTRSEVRSFLPKRVMWILGGDN